jgi:predicted amidohydrolase
VKAGLVQTTSRAEAPEANAARVISHLGAEASADLIVFPELFLCGYELKGIDARAVALDDPPLRSIAEAAARMRTAVVLGFAERTSSGLANSVACMSREGALAGVYRKTALFGNERDVFEPGRELVVVDLAGKLAGLLICFDIEFPEPARQLALAGAEVLVTASANMEPFYADHELASRSRALENRLPHLYANAVGTAGALRFVGGTRSVGPDGEVVAELDRSSEELLLTRIAGPPADEERNRLPEPPAGAAPGGHTAVALGPPGGGEREQAEHFVEHGRR